MDNSKPHRLSLRYLAKIYVLLLFNVRGRNKSIKILLLSHGSTLEGAERSLLEAVQSLVSIGAEVCVVVPREGLLVQKLRETNAIVHFLSTPWWVKDFRGNSSIVKRFSEYAKAVFGMLIILRESKPDVVITNTITIPCGAIASKLVGIPHIWYIREFLEEDHGWSFEFGRQFSVFSVSILSWKVIANSEAIRKRYSDRISSSKIEVVYNAVSIDQDFPLDSPINKIDGIFYAALVGRKSPGKGQKDAIDAVTILLNTYQKVHLWLIGDEFENYAEELKAYVKSLGIDDSISFIPFVKSPAEFMMAADAMLVCSRYEAFGRVVVESMKLGTAVIASNSGSMPELIKDGWNGLLYEPSSASSLADKIRLLSTNREFKKEIETNAYQWANDKFTLKIYSSNLLNIIKDIKDLTRGEIS
jgi:glycosyltransferase involved in cell wall biosynthesis